MIKAKNPEATSLRVARIASDLLSNPNTPAHIKSVAASALTNAPNRATKPSSSKPTRPTGNKSR